VGRPGGRARAAARPARGRGLRGLSSPRVLLPPTLRRGDVVRVVAPSSPFDPDQLARGLDVLSSRLGLVPRMRPDVTARRAYLAGDDARRIEEWREAVADREATAIFCARGGYGAMRLLPAIDPAPLLAHPKLVVGFSDVAAIHALLNRAGLATVHGPVVTQLGRAPPDAVLHLEALLFGTAPRAGAWDVPAAGAGLVASRVVRPGRASGPLLGGTLAILAHLVGTPFAPRLDGAILFLEDVGEKPYRIDRYLTQLRLAGALDGIAALAIGQLTGCDDGGVLAADVVRETALALGVPAVEGLPAGHEDANFALPLGAQATLVAPAPNDEGPPRLLFEGWTRGRPA
jgi:muramoyltetrapeptide carboxypeptidase